MSEIFSRRSFLKLSGALAAASALAACSGGGGGGNGGSGGGYNPNTYHTIDNSLSLSEAVSSYGKTSNSISLTLSFKNAGENQITLSTTAFKDAKLGDANLTVKGFGPNSSQTVDIPSQNDPTHVAVYFEGNNISDSIDSAELTFKIQCGSKVAVCTGHYNAPTLNITVTTAS